MSLAGVTILLISLVADVTPDPRRSACDAIPEMQAEIELTIGMVENKPAPGVVARDPEMALAELVGHHQSELDVLLAQLLIYRCRLFDDLDRAPIDERERYERALGVSRWALARIVEGMDKQTAARAFVGCLDAGKERLTKESLRQIGWLTSKEGGMDWEPLNGELRSSECCPEPLIRSLFERFPAETVRYFAEIEKIDTVVITNMCDRVQYVSERAGDLPAPQAVRDALWSLAAERRWYTDRFVVEALRKYRYYRTPQLLEMLSQDEHRFVKPAVEELLRMEEEAVRQEVEARAGQRPQPPSGSK